MGPDSSQLVNLPASAQDTAKRKNHGCLQLNVACRVGHGICVGVAQFGDRLSRVIAKQSTRKFRYPGILQHVEGFIPNFAVIASSLRPDGARCNRFEWEKLDKSSRSIEIAGIIGF